MKVRVPAAVLAAAACCVSIVLLAQQPSSAPYTVVSREARRPLPVRVIGGQEMFALDDLARLFNLVVREDATAGALTVTAGAQTIVLSPQQPLASVAGRMISLPAAPVRDGRAWYVPSISSAGPCRRDRRRESNCGSRRGSYSAATSGCRGWRPGSSRWDL